MLSVFLLLPFPLHQFLQFQVKRTLIAASLGHSPLHISNHLLRVSLPEGDLGADGSPPLLGEVGVLLQFVEQVSHHFAEYGIREPLFEFSESRQGGDDKLREGYGVTLRTIVL